MSSQWTIDAIAHALPHPELRQTFMREAHLAPIGELQQVFDRWTRFLADFEAERPRIEQLRQHVAEHGTLPADYEAGLVELTLDEPRPAARGAA